MISLFFLFVSDGEGDVLMRYYETGSMIGFKDTMRNEILKENNNLSPLPYAVFSSTDVDTRLHMLIEKNEVYMKTIDPSE